MSCRSAFCLRRTAPDRAKPRQAARSELNLKNIWRCMAISAKVEHKINDDIREKEVRVTDSTGEQLGVMATKVAQDLAIAKDLDLVMIAPQATPPVCKIMDYGKFLFEQQKREKEARKNQKVIVIKEVKLSPQIEDHDIEYKLKNAKKFLKEGDKVKVSVKFRGREMAYTQIGAAVLQKFAEALEDSGVMEKKPGMEGRSMIMIFGPKPEDKKEKSTKK